MNISPTLYSDIVLDHFMNPRNGGELEDANGRARVRNPACGDTMELYIKIEQGTIIDARFMTFGCATAIAASSLLTDLIKNKTITEALDISKQAIAEALGGLTPMQMHCSTLAVESLHAAITDYQKQS